MQDDLIFKMGWVKRSLGWLIFSAGLCALVALGYGIATHWETQDAAELWSAAAIALFVAAFMAMGILIQYAYWRIEDDTIIVRPAHRNLEFRVSELGGYGKTIVTVAVFPMAHLDLYDRDLKPVGRLPVQLKDIPRAEAWLSRRLRYVVNDGSVAFPKRRFADVAKDQHR